MLYHNVYNLRRFQILIDTFESRHVESPSDTRIDKRKEIEKWVA